MTNVWQALAREAELAVEHIAIGITSIGKANYSKLANYAQAFFALSVGFERSSKLALIIDHYLTHDGAFPDYASVRKWGHELRQLLMAVDELSVRRAIQCELYPQWARLPQTHIHKNMIQVLNDFASNITRYYNIDLVTGSSRAKDIADPLASWHELVSGEILKRHYGPRQRSRDEASTLSTYGMESVAYGMFYSESGKEMSVKESAVALARAEFASPFVRLYLLQIARFICVVMGELNRKAYESEDDNIPDLSDFYAMFYNKDNYLKSRKVWSLLAR